MEEQKVLVDPSKEVEITEEEVKELQKYTRELDNLYFNLGLIRSQYLQAEDDLKRNIMMNKSNCDVTTKKIKQKYKIIGEIQSINFSTKKVILK